MVGEEICRWKREVKDSLKKLGWEMLENLAQCMLF